jgi:PPOX class probable F420-dependent enzyme
VKPLSNDLRAFLRRPNPAVVATLRSDGAPVSVATWYLLEDDDRILLNMDYSRVRLRHLRRDPRLSLTVLSEDSWYSHVSLQGEVVELRPDPELTDIDRLSRHYGGERFGHRDARRTSAWMRIDRWHGWEVDG